MLFVKTIPANARLPRMLPRIIHVRLRPNFSDVLSLIAPPSGFANSAKIAPMPVTILKMVVAFLASICIALKVSSSEIGIISTIKLQLLPILRATTSLRYGVVRTFFSILKYPRIYSPKFSVTASCAIC